MPTFDFTAPDGKSYSVEGPDGATPEQAFQMLQQHISSPPQVGRAEDAANSAGSGLANAAVGAVGGLGDLRSGISSATDWAGGKLGVSPDKVQAFKDLATKAANLTPTGAALANVPTSDQIKTAFPDPLVPYDYKPQYLTGDLTKKAAEFAPNMLMGGPEGLGARFLTNVAAPAIGSEIGGKVAGPYGEVAGALLGGAGAGKVANSMREAAALKAATPALADTKSAATNVYDRLTAGNAASPIPQGELDALAGDVRSKLNAAGVRPSNAKGIHDALDELQNPATAGRADVQDLVAARESIKNQLSSPDASKKGAFIALPKIEAAIERLAPGTMKDLKEADKNYGAFKASETLDKKIASADLRASSVDSGMNVGNKIRQKVAALLESGDARYLSAETKADLEKIVRGTWTQNGLRHVANLLGGGGGLGMLAGGTAGYQAGGWGGALAGAAAGRLGKIGNNRSIIKQAEQVSRAIRMRSPLGQQTPFVLPQMTNPLLSASAAALLAARK